VKDDGSQAMDGKNEQSQTGWLMYKQIAEVDWKRVIFAVHNINQK